MTETVCYVKATAQEKGRLAREKWDLEIQEAIRMRCAVIAGMKGALRIAIGLPGGDGPGRATRQFSPEDTLTALYGLDPNIR